MKVRFRAMNQSLLMAHLVQRTAGGIDSADAASVRVCSPVWVAQWAYSVPGRCRYCMGFRAGSFHLPVMAALLGPYTLATRLHRAAGAGSQLLSLSGPGEALLT